MPRPGPTLLRSGGFRLTILCHALALCHSRLAKPSRGLGLGGICVPLLCYTAYTDLWLAGLLSAELAAAFATVSVVLLVYLTTKVHLDSKQNAREHAELRKAVDRLAEAVERQGESANRWFDLIDRRFDSLDRKLDQILTYVLNRRSDKDD